MQLLCVFGLQCSWHRKRLLEAVEGWEPLKAPELGRVAVKLECSNDDLSHDRLLGWGALSLLLPGRYSQTPYRLGGRD